MNLHEKESFSIEDKISRKRVHLTASILLALCIIWLILMGKSMSQVKPEWTDTEYLQWVSKPDIVFILNYINATILTFVNVILFFFLYKFLSLKNKTLPLLGLVFIPIYGVLNIICYSIQISAVPAIAKNALESSGSIVLAIQFVQAKNDTLIGYINGLAYVILGIPSIIYGYLLMTRAMKRTGFFVFINAILSIFGLIGYFIGSKILSMGMMLSGIAFIFGLIFMIIDFKTKEL